MMLAANFYSFCCGDVNAKRVEVFCEFVAFGIIVGITEDIIAIKFATGEDITPRVIGIVVLVAIPFALFGEFVVDQIDFVSLFRKLSRRMSRRK